MMYITTFNNISYTIEVYTNSDNLGLNSKRYNSPLKPFGLDKDLKEIPSDHQSGFLVKFYF